MEDLTLFKITDPFKDTVFEKQNQNGQFDENTFAVFKVSLDERSDYVPINTRTTRHTSYVINLKEKYQFSFQQLEIEKFDTDCLNQFRIYLLVTSVTIFLWLGDEVNQEVKSGSLQIIKAFFQEKMLDKMEFTPSYQVKRKFSDTIKIRFEFQGYESQAFISHLGLTSAMVGTDDIQGYLMLRRPKQAYWMSQKELALQKKVDDDAPELN